ncbi:hypothetical protein ACH5RR_005455 [Cinchona calisaya]|uniref:Senescence regulator n=1 Tax=Cinchona calisaya TaxID=153742 RepID=A0ABD3ALG9_9GENT
MASARKSFFSNYFGGGRGERVNPKAEYEFEESDVWNSNDAVQSDQAGKRPLKKPIRKSGGSGSNNQVNERTIGGAATSLPVNIPDWSRILGDEYKIHRRESEDDFEENDDDGEEYGRLPPHEYLAKTRGSSFSVHEGIGRKLKGRDLNTVRNAVWKQTGFED